MAAFDSVQSYATHIISRVFILRSYGTVQQTRAACDNVPGTQHSGDRPCGFKLKDFASGALKLQGNHYTHIDTRDLCEIDSKCASTNGKQNVLMKLHREMFNTLFGWVREMLNTLFGRVR